MDAQLPDPRSHERSPSPDSRRQIDLCLHNAFAVGNAGSFTSLLKAIGESAQPRR